MRAPIVHFGKRGCACRARWRQAAFLWRSGWLERARQTAPITPGRVSFVATLRIVYSVRDSVGLCDRNNTRGHLYECAYRIRGTGRSGLRAVQLANSFSYTYDGRDRPVCGCVWTAGRGRSTCLPGLRRGMQGSKCAGARGTTRNTGRFLRGIPITDERSPAEFRRGFREVAV